MATITVDGRTIEAQEGAPLVEVLKNNGIYVSSLCYIDGLKPYAGCRSCLVDIEGPPGLQLSCTSIVEDGMVVQTETDLVADARRSVVSLILANHSDRCLTCHRREHCHPGDICLRDDVVTHRCLTCSKNYRCELQVTCEAVGMSAYEPWIGEERTWYQHPQPPADRANPFMEFDPQMCIICTRCQRACDQKRHTGAITLSGKGWTTQIAFGAGGPIHDSNCDFSGACIDVCPTAALMEHPNKWVVKPEVWTTTTCDSCAIGCSIKIGSTEGRGVIVRPGDGNPFSGDQICVRGRYHYDALKPRERLSRHLVRRGQVQVPTALDQTVSGAAEALRQAADQGNVGVLVGATVTNEEARLAAAIAEKLGTRADSSVGPVARAVRGALEERIGTWKAAADLTRVSNSKTIVLIHDDLEESHNVASVRIKDAVVNGGAKLILIGTLRSELVDFATAWIRPSAGEGGRAAGNLADALGADLGKASPVEEAAAILRNADPAGSIVLCAPNPVSPQLAAAMAGGAANLAIAIFGNSASENLVVLPSEVNVHGLQDMGVALEEPTSSAPGYSALLSIRDDPTMREPSAWDALAATPTVVAIDGVLHETAKAASFVLAEGRAYASTGTYTQGDFRVQKLTGAIKPEGEALPLFDILVRLAGELGVEVPATPDLALEHIARENENYREAVDLIAGEGVRLPLKGSGIAKSAPVPAVEVGGPIAVISARDLYTATDAAAARHPEADKLHRYDRIEISEFDATSQGLTAESRIRISAGAASIEAPVSVTERVPPGAVFVSSLFQGGAVAAMFASPGVPGVRAQVVTSKASTAAAESTPVSGGPLFEAAGGTPSSD
ncbi:MAG TPA: 2Fe-2S iron-sulfur cluster-binding protein [Dehalococcoidia bacterium]|nr:2Fe-2S iron-sulfur cluster-binding protein [Dehalococcoidia bacterium]